MSITVNNLTKYYGSEKAVNDISFSVHKGEILGFLGPNGAGKTTTMKIITCYLPPSSGSVEVDGLSVEKESLRVRRKIGYLPELNPLYLDMNVVDYLEYCARLHNIQNTTMKSRLREMIDVCGLTTVRHKDIGELSKGYKQRVGLAQAMIHDPEVLILDEPTSGLDPNQIVEIRNLIRRLGKAKTVILSTHILSEVQATCDRVVIINEGSIVANGTPEELQQQFQGTTKYAVEVKAAVNDPMSDIFPKLKAIEHIDTVMYEGQEGANYRFTLQSTRGIDVREQIFRQSVAENWVLMELSKQTISLEDVFRKLTQAQNN
ncbi:MAG: ATP-binding cassette domain-containing protein [Bacteroidota bacterium]